MLELHQEELLIYAIIHNKKHFIHLIDSHPDEFMIIRSSSFLFEESIYSKIFNLNELGENELKLCAETKYWRMHYSVLDMGRSYTFAELYLLCTSPEPYTHFYKLLKSDKVDYRLKIMRQLRKRKILRAASEEDFPELAKNLDQMPLDVWMQKEFSHIKGVTHVYVVKLLSHLSQLSHLVPTMQTAMDVDIAHRHWETARDYISMEELKYALLHIDEDWKGLAEMMKLQPDFIVQHRNTIADFLARDGASMAMIYSECLRSKQKENYLRVVKAELMGNFRELKYFEGDLEAELGIPLPDEVKSLWQNGLCIERENVSVGEYDDFYSSMFLGIKPERTCLSYLDGAYRECLFSVFDSNKKLLYATKDGEIVGRAFIRLTKGTTDHHSDIEDFTFADLEHKRDLEEHLVLFLERPYIRNVNEDYRAVIEDMFVSLMKQKAIQMGIDLVVNNEYSCCEDSDCVYTWYSLYISRTKASSQYLDSLSGCATTSSEGKYMPGRFYIYKAKEDI